MAIAFQPRGPGATDEVAARAGQKLVGALRDAGLSQVRLETLALKPAVVCGLGVNPSGEPKLAGRDARAIAARSNEARDTARLRRPPPAREP
jgi:hypothetical protein